MKNLSQASTPARLSAPEAAIRTRARSARFPALRLLPICFAVAVAVAAPGPGRYTAKSGQIAFNVGSNVPFLSVSGSSSAFTGGGQGEVTGDVATVRDLRFEVVPTTFKTGMKVRDEHLYDKVFKTGDGSIPAVVLRADRFEARLNPKTSKWEGTLNAQLTLHGVTKPVSFRASLEKKGSGALVSAEGSVKTSDFGVPKISYSGATINNNVTISVSRLRVDP